ncbi:uncharacterized protein IL334_003764 [Kwoniella shivajii]|uniref:Peptidase C14 caspase domain-containing protein n=1 Tax=Kwoniella shivajii TaxID=564305 RepID=A0ABZ1D1G4_9TREE|nr:hypothetical protein IL334_003764 [Kwoniella shivajii]
MSDDEYEAYEDAGSHRSDSDSDRGSDHEKYESPLRQDRVHEDSECNSDHSSGHSHHSHHSHHDHTEHHERHSSHSSSSHEYQRQQHEHHEDYRDNRQEDWQTKRPVEESERAYAPVEEPFYRDGSSEQRHNDDVAFAAEGLGSMALGGFEKQHQTPPQQFEGYKQGSHDQAPSSGDYRANDGDYYNLIPPPGPPSQEYHPTGAGYVPYQQYQAPQPPYGDQYNKGSDDEQPRQHHYGPTFTDPETGEVAQAFFEYSKCSGTRKALLIGINYFGTSGQLNGCINDVHNVQKFICERFGYRPADIVMLTDDAIDPRTSPTRDNIIRGMQWLVEGAQRDDALFFHYSGHGTQSEDTDGDEGDDDDEAICPLDYQSAGLLIDDDSKHDLLVRPLPAGCRLTAIFDSCHSGTVMDLPYVYSPEGKIKEPDLLIEAKEGLLGAGMDVLRGDTGGIMSNLFGAAKSVFDAKKADQKTKKTNTSPADIIQWAGCKDNQTSADTQEEGKATGAMSYAFIAALTKYPNQSYQQLLTSIREEMQGKYTQKPQLSACHPIDTELQFVA